MPPPPIQRQINEQRVRDLWDARPAEKRRHNYKEIFVGELERDECGLYAGLGVNQYQTIMHLLMGRESD